MWNGVTADAPPGEKRNEFTLELRRIVGDMTPCVFTNNKHLSEMGLGGSVHLKGVFVTTLLFAHLAVPPQALQAL